MKSNLQREAEREGEEERLGWREGNGDGGKVILKACDPKTEKWQCKRSPLLLSLSP